MVTVLDNEERDLIFNHVDRLAQAVRALEDSAKHCTHRKQAIQALLKLTTISHDLMSDLVTADLNAREGN